MKFALSAQLIDNAGNVGWEDNQVWHDCNWSDITVIQAVLVQALDKLVELGFANAMGVGELTEDQYDSFNQVLGR